MAESLSYIEEARCLKVKTSPISQNTHPLDYKHQSVNSVVYIKGCLVLDDIYILRLNVRILRILRQVLHIVTTTVLSITIKIGINTENEKCRGYFHNFNVSDYYILIPGRIH